MGYWGWSRPDQPNPRFISRSVDETGHLAIFSSFFVGCVGLGLYNLRPFQCDHCMYAFLPNQNSGPRKHPIDASSAHQSQGATSKPCTTVSPFGHSPRQRTAMHLLTAMNVRLDRFFRGALNALRALHQDEFIEMELKTLQASGVHPNVVDCFGFIRTTFR